MSIGIYKIVSPEGKIYIGQSWNINKRKTKYKYLNCKLQPKLYESLNLYGFDAHIFEIILLFNKNISQEILDYNEIKYIKLYKDLGYKLLNIKPGGSKGRMSEESKLKLSRTKLGKKKPDGFKIKCSERMKKFWEEYRNTPKELRNRNMGRKSNFSKSTTKNHEDN